MSVLASFTVDGKEVIDENAPPNEDGDPQYLLEADPQRTIHRYDEHNNYINTYARLNRDLLDVAASLPLLSLKISHEINVSEQSTSDATWDIRNSMRLFARAFDEIAKAPAQACVLGTQHCQNLWSRLYLSVEDAASTQEIFSTLCERAGVTVEFQQSSLAQVGYKFLPLEMFFDLLGEQANSNEKVDVGFGFTGASDALGRLEKSLSKSGFEKDELNAALLQMRMRKNVTVDQSAFLDLIREVFAISRKDWAHYRSEELLSAEVISLKEKLPEKYRAQRGSIFSRIFGGRN